MKKYDSYFDENNEIIVYKTKPTSQLIIQNILLLITLFIYAAPFILLVVINNFNLNLNILIDNLDNYSYNQFMQFILFILIWLTCIITMTIKIFNIFNS